jgi:hypothetical protein
MKMKIRSMDIINPSNHGKPANVTLSFRNDEDINVYIKRILNLHASQRQIRVRISENESISPEVRDQIIGHVLLTYT